MDKPIQMIAWDVGVANHGFAVMKFDETTIELVQAEHFKVSVPDMSHRLFEIHRKFTELYKEFTPSMLAYEKPVFRRGDVGSKMDQVIGVVTLKSFLKDIVMFPYAASEVKKCVTGNAKADKQDVEDAVNNILGKKEVFTADHASDAVAIGLTHYMQNKT